jgi:hypothetical protein
MRSFAPSRRRNHFRAESEDAPAGTCSSDLAYWHERQAARKGSRGRARGEQPGSRPQYAGQPQARHHARA